MEITIKKQIETTETIKLPLFLLYVCPSTGAIDAMGIFNEHSMAKVDYHEGTYVYLYQSSPNPDRFKRMEKAWEITEEEFFKHYNKALKLLDLTPRLKQ